MRLFTGCMKAMAEQMPANMLAGATAAINGNPKFTADQKKAELEKLVAENGWSEDDVAREREKAAFKDLTDRENVFFSYTR